MPWSRISGCFPAPWVCVRIAFDIDLSFLKLSGFRRECAKRLAFLIAYKWASASVLQEWIRELQKGRTKLTIKLRTVTRAGLRDIWNAFMVKGAAFSKNGIPFCPNTTSQIPESLITYDEAVQIYNQELRRKNKYFHSQSFVCFFIDDYKFDNPSGIWFRWKLAQKILEHFEGIITPDFSTYQDFPLPLKLFATYKMRTFGYWCIVV